MVFKTFDATVSGGQLRHGESLSALEGQTVRVTVIVPEQVTREASLDIDEPPDWMDVEHEVYVRMPRRVETLGPTVIVERGRRRPTIILPEDLPDE